jgi:hypothetical protein
MPQGWIQAGIVVPTLTPPDPTHVDVDARGELQMRRREYIGDLGHDLPADVLGQVLQSALLVHPVPVGVLTQSHNRGSLVLLAQRLPGLLNGVVAVGHSRGHGGL